jgi:GntR family transcriptional regulator, transcriptional repressor for pyruvate dehydrogenase complex
MVQPFNTPIEDKLTPVRRENLNEKIVTQIKALIFSKGVEPGDRLPSERVLTQQFQVSRAVVRQALKSLEQSGLVQIRTGAGGGAFVANNYHMPLLHATYDLFDSGRLTLSHFCEARKSIECSSIRLAVQKITPEDLERLHAINRQLLDDLNGPANLRATKHRESNIAFHVAIAEMSGNPLIQLIIQSIMDLLGVLYIKGDQIGSQAFMKDTYRRHQAIIEAVEARDEVRCEQSMALDTNATGQLSLSLNQSPSKS